MVFATGWASGVNAYGVIFVIGLLGRLGAVDDAPAQLQSYPILVAALVLYCAEFIADKIPYVDSVWDLAHTVIRPALAAYLGALIAGDAAAIGSALHVVTGEGPVSSVPVAVAAVLGGATALASHGVKTAVRLAVNTSPEPLSNIVISCAEDLAVIFLVILALAFPGIAAAICAVLLIAGLLLAYALSRVVRRGWARWKRWRERSLAAAG